MRTNKVGNRAILLSMIALLFLLSCDEELVPFAAFRADVEIEEDELEVEGRFTLGPGSNGIDPRTENVILSVGSFTTMIPAGAFELTRPGLFGAVEFEGVIDGVELEFEIRILDGNSYAFKAEAEETDLTGIVNLVKVTLIIGDDSGTVRVFAEIDND